VAGAVSELHSHEVNQAAAHQESLQVVVQILQKGIHALPNTKARFFAMQSQAGVPCFALHG
jgi:hypothetical protein